jgi:hypothetical protein
MQQPGQSIMPSDQKPARIIVGDAQKMQFYLEHYDLLFTHNLGPSSPNQTLGTENVCRFCGRRPPEATFRKLAHAVPELVGNKRLFSLYECDGCNSDFSAFEDELAKSAAIFLFSAQVKGKKGVPKLRSRQKLSRAEINEHGVSFQEHADDPMISIDETTRTARLKLKHQRYRPLGVYKALTKMALTLMPEHELNAFPEAMKWIKAPIAQGAIVKPSICLRTFIPGPRPIPEPHVILLRRKPGKDVPYSMLFLATGNTSFQVIVPCPVHDGEGHAYSFPPVPMTTFLNLDLAQGPPLHYQEDLSSPDLVDAPSEMTFHFDELKPTPKVNQPETAPPGPL